MRKVTYTLGTSLDGYIAGPDGGFGWGAPDKEVFRFCTDQVRAAGAHLLGRNLYETMRYWESEDPASFDEDELEFASLWNALPKVVFSNTLTEVEGSNTRLATGGLAEEVERLRAEPGEGQIAIGGAALAAAAAELDLIDEYQPRVSPVLVGGGVPFFPQAARQVDLELVETRPFASQIVFLRYRVRR